MKKREGQAHFVRGGGVALAYKGGTPPESAFGDTDGYVAGVRLCGGRSATLTPDHVQHSPRVTILTSCTA